MSDLNLQRVNVVGVSGSGKSTFARRLAAAQDSHYIEMDRLYWQPNWVESAISDFRLRVSQALQADNWVLDGNYHSKTYDLKFARATSIIWLDMSFGRTVVRAISRAWRRSWSQAEIWPNTGNRESFRRSFASRESVVLWTLTNYHATKRRYVEMQRQSSSGMPFLRLATPCEVDSILQSSELLSAAKTIRP